MQLAPPGPRGSLPTGTGTIRVADSLCLDVPWAQTHDGNPAQVVRCNGTAAQRWTYDASARTLRHPQSGRCLDATGGTPVFEGQRLSVWDCHGAPNQRWSL